MDITRAADVAGTGTFDIFATAGSANKAVVEEFTATADENGQITVHFSYAPPYAYASVSGIEVLSGDTPVAEIDAGGGPGPRTITSAIGTFLNQGTLSATNGETLLVTLPVQAIDSSCVVTLGEWREIEVGFAPRGFKNTRANFGAHFS